MLAQAFTLHDLIQTGLEHISSYNSGLQVWIERQGNQVRYFQKFVEALPRDQVTEAVHYGLASAVASSCYGRGAAWQPTRIELPTDPVDLTVYFPGLADLPIAFHQPHTSVTSGWRRNRCDRPAVFRLPDAVAMFSLGAASRIMRGASRQPASF